MRFSSLHGEHRHGRLAVAIAASCLVGVLANASAAAEDFKLNVHYVCNGERIYVESCNIRDLSDSATCQVAHPDRPLHNGFMVYTSETRGSLKKLLPTCQQPTAQEIAKYQAFEKRQQEVLDANTRKYNPQPPPPSAQPAEPVNGMSGGLPAPPKNAEERAMRRCVSSGRLPASCTGNQLLGAFSNMLTSVLGSAAGTKEVQAGPNMAGVFQGAGNWRLDFIDEGVLVNCAFLSPNQEAYTINLSGGHAVLTINTRPKPLVLTVHNDGTIVGPPGQVTIDGVVASGYVSGAAGTGAVYQDASGNLYDGAHNRVPGNANAGYTTFTPKRATCPAISLSSKGAAVGVQTMQTDLLKTMFGGDKGAPTPPGIRMHGIYAAATGFSVQFFPESAIVGCGPDAARAYPYSVVTNAAGAEIKIEAPDHPLTLAYKADGALDPANSGPYQVHGRIVTGQDDNGDFTFAPFELSCNLGMLGPSQQIPSGGGVASMAAANGGRAAGGAGLSTAAAPLGDAILSVASGLAPKPGLPNPLAGRPYVLLRANYGDALAQGGVSVPPGTSPYKFVGLACAGRTPDCQRSMSAIQANAASAVRSDATGAGIFPGVPPGTYYLMISAMYNNQSLMWGQAVQLRSGRNLITLDLSNATPLQ